MCPPNDPAPFETLWGTVGPGQGRADVWLPPHFTHGRRWPLLVFLHGYGERGRDGEHLPVGLGPVLAEDPGRFPGIVVMPQCPADRVWVSIDRSWSVGMPDAEDHIDAAVAAVAGRYPVDRARIALTGLSMGGFAVFVHGARRTGSYRAMAAVCGGGRPEDGEVLSRVPLWVLHGALDELVPVAESRRMVDAIRAAGGGSLRYTEYPDLGHRSWDRAYREPGLLEFLCGDGADGTIAEPRSGVR
jgi:predicted peptidase